MASLALNPQTQNIKVAYVQSPDPGIDFLFSANQSLLQIHDKWLDFKKIHETASCQVSVLVHGHALGPGSFSCDHIVEELYELVLADVTESLGLGKGELAMFARTLRHKARDMLRQMPRRVNVMVTGNPCQLEVSWIDCNGDLVSDLYGINVQYCVTLHRESTCAEERQRLLREHGESFIQRRKARDSS